MSTVRVYDLPTRVFHWSFAGLFATAYAIANLVDDDSARFAWHMLAGVLMGVAVLLRVAWGVVGTRHARWSDLSLDPRQLAAYLKGVVAGGGRRWAGHNPASSWAALAMVGMALGMAGSGLAMAAGVAPEWVEEAHELVANTFLAVALLHVAGLLLHALRHRDGLPASMVTGRKRDLAAEVAPVPARGVAALLMLGVLASAGVGLARAYDPATRSLDLFGTRLVLGEDGGEAHGAGAEGEDHDDDGDEGHDDD
ncbi:cytochrome b/b6 domain-containing protein [Thermomonas mangrovi]|uniref:cytochrome b/b6 domain-containing protein n=1 Tax=Thermomonas mangrovi TaxID=2993316 RepID=UPI002307B3E7|nr:cytochrome b/b6 domain-containing protein [Thermomonas mangrovi]